MFDILIGVVVLHMNGIGHRDMKFHNILFREDDEGRMIIKITDFGLAKILAENNTPVGTMMFVAPEVLDAHRVRARVGEHAVRPADMWSVGVMLYILLGGTEIQDSRKLHKLAREVAAHRDNCPPETEPRSLPFRRQPSQAAVDLCHKMLHPDPLKRCTAVDAAWDAFFQTHGQDFSLVLNAMDEFQRGAASTTEPLALIGSPQVQREGAQWEEGIAPSSEVYNPPEEAEDHSSPTRQD
jgi:serine/threonine protein kinase